MDMDYDADVSIDETALDLEWIDHPRRMMAYCAHVAAAQRELDLSKERLDVVKAELDQQIRSDPEKYGLGTRVTEGSVQSAITVQPEYQDATKSFITRKYEHGIAQGVVRAFEHRKSALENLVRLHGQNYFAGPAVPRDLSDERRLRDDARRSRDVVAQSRVRGLRRRQ